jgi:hypothetical protein
MRSEPGSFSWSEDLDESLNYWFWLRRTEDVPDEVVAERVRAWMGKGPWARHQDVETESRWAHYQVAWPNWRRDAIAAQIDESRIAPPSVNRRHYQAVAAIGLRSFQVQWVMAPIGERWLFPPDLAVLGVDGATSEGRRHAVLDAAKAVKESQR